MTTNSDPRPAASGSLDLEKLAAHQKTIAYILIGLGGAMLAVPIVNGILYRDQAMPVIVWGCAVSLTLLLAGVIYMNVIPSGRMTGGDLLRLVALITLGATGLATALLGLVLPFTQPYSDILGGGLQSWRDNWSVLFKCGVPLFAGLVLMFLGVQMARTFERSQALMRRLLYGYNTVLSSLLLLIVLLLVNVLGYVGLPPFSLFSEIHDLTASRTYSLSTDMTNLLTKGLTEPVKVYAIVTVRSARPVVDLLTLCKSVAGDRFGYEVLTRDSNGQAIRELGRKYSLPPTSPFGLLVVYGTGDSAPSDFIKEDDLFETQTPGMPQTGPEPFVGERALLRSLLYLKEGKTKAKVYFTQGNGELSVTDGNPDSGGLGLLYRRLAASNFEPKVLDWTPTTKAFPDDADLVVIARPDPPTGRLSDDFLNAVRTYLKKGGGKKGKLVVLMDVIGNGNTPQMPLTGLEAVLEEYGVRVNNDRILALDGVRGDPTAIQVAVNPNNSTPVAQAFSDPDSGASVPFVMIDARSVEPTAEPKPGLQVEPFILAFAQQRIWIEKDMTHDPRGQAAELRKPGAELDKVLSRRPLPVAVTVTAVPAGRPREPQPSAATPRMAVFGDSTWLSNKILESQEGRYNYGVFSSTLAWLRERGDYGPPPQIPGKTPRVYETKLDSPHYYAVVVLPGIVMLFAVIALGGAVWVVRRR
jgi:hypothetical protein